MNLGEFEEGERVLFEGRKTPLKVVKASDTEIEVEGPKGGRYRIYRDGDTVLYCKPGNEKYSSYCKNLRKVGEWVREGNRWKHTGSGATLELEKADSGLFKIKTDLEIDTPMYGFTDKEKAVEFIQKKLEDRPEG